MSTLPERVPPDGTLPTSGPPAWAREPEPPPAQIGEFEIVSKLGAGAFGQVYLARQSSLGRLVALKLFEGPHGAGSEGQLLAGLEHDHIVKVFSAVADPDTGSHGLCLQYVPGADLGVVIQRVFAGGRAPDTGGGLLAALDAVRRGDPDFDPAALRDRELLARDDFPQAVCRIGGRLAEALAFAHARGVLHCDIKPANILLTPYGRPMLADFNVAFDRTRIAPDQARYGGTLAYMAPEYRAAVYGQPGGSADERCDVYSLGMVLHELATGVRPGAAPAPADPLAVVPRELGAVIRRCLDPDPARRYPTAADLAAALTGARQLLAARRALPPPSTAGRWAAARPGLALGVAALVPNLVASIAQIGYNAVEVQLDDGQTQAFATLVIVYNVLAYPACYGTVAYLAWQVARGMRGVGGMAGPDLDVLRHRATRLAVRVAALCALGWVPGAVIFPLVIDLAAGPLPWQVYAHFAVSFVMAGVIAVVFCYLGIQYVVFRALLPRLGNPDTHTPDRAWAEVRPLTAAFDPLVGVACGVPLIGAVLLLTLEDGTITLGFRVLVVGLIGLGAAGVLLAERLVRTLWELASVWRPGAEAGGPGHHRSWRGTTAGV